MEEIGNKRLKIHLVLPCTYVLKHTHTPSSLLPPLLIQTLQRFLLEFPTCSWPALLCIPALKETQRDSSRCHCSPPKLEAVCALTLTLQTLSLAFRVMCKAFCGSIWRDDCESPLPAVPTALLLTAHFLVSLTQLLSVCFFLHPKFSPQGHREDPANTTPLSLSHLGSN